MAALGSDNLAYRFQYATTNELTEIVDFGVHSTQHIHAARAAVVELLRRSSSVFHVAMDASGFHTTVAHGSRVQDAAVQLVVDVLWDTYHESVEERQASHFRSVLRDDQQADADTAYTTQFAVETTAHYHDFLSHEHITTTTPGVPHYLNILSGLTIYGQLDGGQTEVSLYEQLKYHTEKLHAAQHSVSVLSPFDVVHAFLLQHSMFHTYYAPIHESFMRSAIQHPDMRYTVYRTWVHIIMVSYFVDAVEQIRRAYPETPASWVAVKVHEAMPPVDDVLAAVERMQPVLIASYEP